MTDFKVLYSALDALLITVTLIAFRRCVLNFKSDLDFSLAGHPGVQVGH